ncbi:putative cytochrome p450 protein [Botrytis fragariae]|uniref:Putative cytochrome p450 protein n=1 Tax=Botrytis fragariae TaxID=1964551 RepID=A0A8H6EJ27_9HELO|nr:putative cytochrome p450 protein [Botrytis fragariae]KAF5874081.1 putative cytochrome p450 protein [Botrytis fragariae]
MARSIRYLTTDIISHLCFGHPFGFVKSHTDVYGFIYTLESRLSIVENFSVIVELNRMLGRISYIPCIKRFLLLQPTDTYGLGKIIGISWRVVEELFTPNTPIKKDILGSFLKHGISREQAESGITISLFARSDTTSSSLRGTLLHVATFPRVYTRLREELSGASMANAISTPITNQEATTLPYLQACIREGLRIFSPITLFRERVVHHNGDTILGHFVPANTNVGINMTGMLLDDVFGLDPDMFHPERWFEKEISKLRKMEQVQDLVFGYGGTRCLKVRIANMTLNKAIVEVRSIVIKSAILHRS